MHAVLGTSSVLCLGTGRSSRPAELGKPCGTLPGGGRAQLSGPRGRGSPRVLEEPLGEHVSAWLDFGMGWGSRAAHVL